MRYFQNIIVQLLFVVFLINRVVNSLRNLQRIPELNQSRQFLKFSNEKKFAPRFSELINPTGCGRRIDEIRGRDLNKIVGGVVADPEDWGWQTALEFNGRFFCGGSLINSHWVVTAAHCFNRYGIQTLSEFVLRFGLHDRENPESYSTTRNVNKIIIHPNYNSVNLDNDIALMSLSTPLSYTDQILPICIPDQSQNFAGESSWATGWGSQEYSGFPLRNLMEVELPILSNSRCIEKYPRVNTEIAFCAGEEGQNKDTCQGDSGGPLVVKSNNKWFLAGITSWGIGCGDGGVYAKTSYYTNWIVENIGSVQFSESTSSNMDYTTSLSNSSSFLIHYFATNSSILLILYFWL